MIQSEFFAEVESHYNAKNPLVVYKYPTENTLHALLQNDSQIHLLNDFQEVGFVVHSYKESKNFYFPLDKCRSLESTFNLTSDPSIHKADETTLMEVSSEFDRYTTSIKEIIESIAKNEVNKVVLSRSKIVEFELTNLGRLIEELIKRNGNAFSYCFYHPDIGLWLGASPEQLVKVENGSYEIMSLAGTKLISENRAWTKKEVQEQKIVTEYIKEAMKELSEEMIIHDTQDRTAGHLIHQLSMIKGILKTSPSVIEELIFKLHPTPAVCGSPKSLAMKLIDGLEKSSREYYTGFLGEMNMIQGVKYRDYYSFFVNLRCMQLYRNFAKIYVGGGITKDSIPEKEWRETEHKSLIMNKLLTSVVEKSI